jgi:predicted phage terminase large subunit-like protein
MTQAVEEAPTDEAAPTFELDIKELARFHVGWFAFMASQRKWMPAAHLRLLAEKLNDVATGKIQRLIVNMPPRHGKSTLIAQFFIAWYLSLHPRQRVIFASYADGYARQWGAAARDTFYENGEMFGVTCNPKAAAGFWEVLANEDGRGWKPTGGYMKSVGVGAGLTGYGAEVIVVDDPVKDYKEAASAVTRENVWHWFNAVLMTRLQPDGAVVLCMTRWHHDDLVGRLLEQDAQGDGEGWEVLNLPALAEIGQPDPIGRRPGEALWPEAWGAERMERVRRARGSYIWSALYQGRPTPLTGGMFRFDDWAQYYTAIQDGDRPAVLMFRVGTIVHRVKLDDLTTFATVDLASSTKTSADYTVIQVWAIGRGRRLFLLDQTRERAEGPDIVPLMWNAYRKWDLSSLWVEQVNFELSLIQEARRKGLPVRQVRPKGDKITRALPATAKMEGGMILFPQAGASWWDEFKTEVSGFPKAKNDDQVDCMSYAVQVAKKIAKAKRHVSASYGGAGSNTARRSPPRPPPPRAPRLAR